MKFYTVYCASFKMMITIFLISCYFTGVVWSQSFKAAVVDYSPVPDTIHIIPEARLMKNYEEYKKVASKQPQDYDIIVFPESTLYTGTKFDLVTDIFPYSTVVPEPESNVIPCDDNTYTYASFLKGLSCVAKENGKFMVINIAENVRCKEAANCSGNGYDVYNTNVVFNGEGKVIAKYQKYHLFGEQYMTKPKMQQVTFDLKPGVKVGIFTCFDIMFKEPALSLVKEQKIQAAVYPLMWYSELPFLTALQTQQQWARELNITLLAAGANQPAVASGGSGIYKGSEGLKQGGITSAKKTNVFYQDVNLANINIGMQYSSNDVKSIDAKAKEMDGFGLWKEDLRSYTSMLFDPLHGKQTVCYGTGNGKFCCEFDIKASVDQTIVIDGNNHYVYHLLAFSGVRSLAVATAGIEVCALVACKNNSVNSCGVRFENYSNVSWPVEFTSIEVKAKFIKSDNRIQFPNSLLSNIQPIDHTEWYKREVDGAIERTHKLTSPQSRLLTFGIFGRDFSRDDQPVTEVPTSPSEDDEHEKSKPSPSNITTLEMCTIFVSCFIVIINFYRL